MWNRNSTRQAILAAARRVAEREGAEAMTLSRVAAEAGFAPPAVYAHFVSKNDLYLAVIADDLAALARTMRGDTAADGDVGSAQPEPAAQDDASRKTAVIALHPADVPSPTAARQVSEAAESKTMPEPLEGEKQKVSLADIQKAIGVVLASDADGFYEEDYSADTRDVPNAFPDDEVEKDTPGNPGPSPDGGAEASSPAKPEPRVERRAEPDPQDLQRRSQPARREASGLRSPVPLFDSPAHAAQRKFANTDEMAAAIAQLEQAMARLEARPVDAWLERRLRVFERTLADVESRMDKAERDSTTALSTVSEGFKALEERFDITAKTIAQRGEDSERRQRAVAADLRMYVKDLSGRLSAVETSLSRMLGEADDTLVARARAHAALLPHNDDVDEDMIVPPQGDAEDVDEAPPARRDTGESYLTAARRAANDAAARAELLRPRSPLDYLKLHAGAGGRSLPRRTLHLATGILGLAVVLIGANIVLRGHATIPAAPAATSRVAVLSDDQRVAALAKAGNPKAALIVALKFLNGDGVATDVPTAVHWMTRAAAGHEPLAEYWLGTFYERGRGVSKDAKQAMQWYGAAAHAGNAKAMYRLGVAYADGWNGEPDYSEAARWFTSAAELGVIDAQFNLAVLYERGEGVPQNPANAFRWYAIAAGQGDAESKARLDALATQIGADDAAAAQKQAATFVPATPDPAANAEPLVADVARLK